ncbi:cytidylyltransferase domain-containing protein [Paenibacillus marinisediminis]
MKTIVIIQARMGSTRLPGKVLMPLNDSPVLKYVVERSKQIDGVNDVIVATSTLVGDDPIEQWCLEHDIPCYRGSEEDVLARYYECARIYQPQYVIRVTADCPYVDYHMASEIVKSMMKKPVDIIRVNGELPRGLIVEMISFKALSYIFEHGHEDRHREHVTYYAYEYPNQFTFSYLEPSAQITYPELRITLDTPEDYAVCQAVAAHFKGDILVSAEKVIQYLREHPDIANMNASIQQKPVI